MEENTKKELLQVSFPSVWSWIQIVWDQWKYYLLALFSEQVASSSLLIQRIVRLTQDREHFHLGNVVIVIPYPTRKCHRDMSNTPFPVKCQRSYPVLKYIKTWIFKISNNFGQLILRKHCSSSAVSLWSVAHLNTPMVESLENLRANRLLDSIVRLLQMFRAPEPYKVPMS